jgi:hypothetical protein
MVAKKKQPSAEELAASFRDEAAGPATEVLQHLSDALLLIPAFKLRDSRECKVEPYYAPQDGQDGLKCGIDVRLPDGHLEYTIANTGWGRSIQEQKATGKERQR